jgi:hypothetical protein
MTLSSKEVRLKLGISITQWTQMHREPYWDLPKTGQGKTAAWTKKDISKMQCIHEAREVGLSTQSIKTLLSKGSIHTDCLWIEMFAPY